MVSWLNLLFTAPQIDLINRLISVPVWLVTVGWALVRLRPIARGTTDSLQT